MKTLTLKKPFCKLKKLLKMPEHEKFMKQAIAKAEKGRGQVSPNPLVGALVVQNGKVISKGYHTAYGRAHAEVEALKNVNQRLKASLYVTLEPCSHYGKTPPCLDLIKKYKNLDTIVIGCKDPNPQVNGKSIKELKKIGFKVTTGILAKEVKKQNETYFYYMANKRPFVTLKAAMTLDGKIATESGESKWITSASTRKLSHKLRIENDAIMVGIGTVLADDPLLIPRNVKGNGFRPPVRIIIDPRLKIPLDSKIIKTAKAYPTIVVCSHSSNTSKQRQLEKLSVKTISLPEKNGRLCLKDLMSDLGSRNITSLMIEGGSDLNSAAWKEEIVNKLVLFAAPKIFGGNELPVIGGKGVNSLEEANSLKITRVEHLGHDILIEAYVT